MPKKKICLILSLLSLLLASLNKSTVVRNEFCCCEAESRSNRQQNSFLIKTAVLSRHQSLKLTQTFVHLVLICLN